MDWLWQIFDAIQKSALYAALDKLAFFDWLALSGILWGMLYGGRRGFSEMFGKVAGVILVSLLVMNSYPQFAAILANAIPPMPKKVAEPIAFFLQSVFMWIVVFWALGVLGKFLKIEVSGMLKFLGGLFLGAAFIAILLSFIAQFLLFLPVETVRWMYKDGQSYSGRTIIKIVPQMQSLIGRSCPQPVIPGKVQQA